ncbi:MAG: cytidine deaminase [Selenomonadaceae bacterium]
MAKITELSEGEQRLVEAAAHARSFSYSPYSHFAVGAAVMTSDGEIYSGCNIENQAYSVTNCAERTAIFNAVSEGHDDITLLAVIADTPAPTAPCGACRQVIAEFGIPNIIMANTMGDVKVVTIDELLPAAFGAEDMK